MAIVKVTRNSQITIPKEVREKVGIKEGDRVDVTVEGDKVVIRKIEMEEITDFLPRDFEETMNKMRKDSRDRLRELGVIP
ncbi:AbrB/MazE/SpoVT family DNA-binding domain-containing protein [Geoglobus acetivorans]|uniref:AbrB/MazE/SpoVT family DNA-binding domain-containing protein n=1 Tax=Geoglobus acetivorans TaxID=565033 RepID=A0ABZ3H4S4_GEOAI|nr:AbrB/MazE/SpoVT family DNA-binding domain-containing protein [Geoglobus acetivorans]